MADTFTVKEAEDAARLTLLDTSPDAYRFEPKEMFAALSSAIVRIHTIRPESRYVAGLLVDYSLSVPAQFTDETLATYRSTEIEMERRWFDAAVYFMVYRMYLKDDPDTSNSKLADHYLQLFTGELT